VPAGARSRNRTAAASPAIPPPMTAIRNATTQPSQALPAYRTGGMAA
jgi:hypothetical protein